MITMGIISDSNKKDIKSRKKHITYEERIIIERYIKDKMSIPKIAVKIGKNRKSTYPELKEIDMRINGDIGYIKQKQHKRRAFWLKIYS